MPLVHREKEKPLKLKDSQMADLKIGVLLGLGLRNNATIGAKIGYSESGVKNRRKGVNALFIAEIESTVKHEIDVNRKIAERVAAEDLKKELGEFAGQVLANHDEALRSLDPARKDRATKVVSSYLIPRSRISGPGKPDSTDPPPAVYHVRIGSLNVLQQHAQGAPITLPDIAKTLDVPGVTHLPPGERS